MARRKPSEIGDNFIRLPRNMCANSDSLADLISTVLFPGGIFSSGAAILVARNTEVDEINKMAMDRFPGQVRLAKYGSLEIASGEPCPKLLHAQCRQESTSAPTAL